MAMHPELSDAYDAVRRADRDWNRVSNDNPLKPVLLAQYNRLVLALPQIAARVTETRPSAGTEEPSATVH